jgi:hypothetical protein
MAIPPFKPGGYGPNDTPHAAELAELDAKLATRGLDSTAADTATGTISALGAWTTTAGKTVLVSGLGTSAQTTLGSGARFVLGDNDYVQYTASRTRTVFIHPTEAAFSFVQGDQYRIDDTNLSGTGATYGLQNQSGSGTVTLTVPIAKPHDAATITQVVAYFQVPVSILGGVVPASLPTLVLGRRAISTGAFTSVASTTFGTPASPTAYYNAGAPNTMTVNPGSNNVEDLTTYDFAIQVTDDSSPLARRIIWTGFKIVYGSIADNRPSQ